MNITILILENKNHIRNRLLCLSSLYVLFVNLFKNCALSLTNFNRLWLIIFTFTLILFINEDIYLSMLIKKKIVFEQLKEHVINFFSITDVIVRG